MPEEHYLTQIVIVIGTAVIVSSLFRAIRLPSIIGFLITGVAIGPSGWSLIPPETVRQFSELGLVLLLFTVGLELSPEPLFKSGRPLVIATGAQVLLTTLLTALALHLLMPLGLLGEIVIGLAVALSSTAIVLKQMSDRQETRSTPGLITTGILLLQDILVIVVLLVASLASAREGATWHSAALRGVGGLAGLAAIIFIARRALPHVLDGIFRYGGRELITLFAVLMACGGACLADLAGWSPALGACIAGLLLADTDQRHQLVAEITPFRDVFNALFFVSLGMLVDMELVIQNFWLLQLAVLATLLVKTLLTTSAVRIAGWPTRIGIQVGVGLCTVSEFSYVLARQAYELNVLPEQALGIVVAYAVCTMILGALLFPLAGPLAMYLTGRLRPETEDSHATPESEAESFRDHVVLVGYGTTDSNLARMLRATQVPHCVVEMNLALVSQARKDGEKVIVGDATRLSILEHACIDTARVLVVAINDKRATQRVVAQARARKPDIYILARTSFASDIEALYQRGASLVIPEDFETSIEVAAHVLSKFGIPDNIIEAQIAAVRSGGYAMLRGKPTTRAIHTELMKILERTTTQTFYLADDSYCCGKSLGELNLRARTGCTIIAIVRAGSATPSPGPDYVLKANDVLVLVGAHAHINAAKALLQRTEPPDETGRDNVT